MNRNTRNTITRTLFCATLVFATGASATPWQYPDEIGVASAYNLLYGTAYDTDSVEGLQSLLGDHAGAMTSLFTLDQIPSLTVLAFDTSSTLPLGIRVAGERYYELFDPGPWTAPTRGWINDPSDPGFSSSRIDLAAYVNAGESFELVIGGSQSGALGPDDTVRIEGLDGRSFLLAHNDGGRLSGDSDLNEPLIYVSMRGGPASVPEPRSGMLLGLVGVAGLLLASLRTRRARCGR